MGRGYLTVAVRQKMGYPLRGYVPMGIRQPMSANSNISNEKMLNTPSILGPQRSILMFENKYQINFDNPATIVNENLRIYEDIAESPKEIFGLFDKQGNPILSPIDVEDEYGDKSRIRTHLFGSDSEYSVNVPPSVLIKMKDNIWTHNHPGGWSSFSLPDIAISAMNDSAGGEIRHPKMYWNNIEELVKNKNEILSVIRNVEKNTLTPLNQDTKNSFKYMEQELGKMTFNPQKPLVVEQISRNGKWHKELIDIISIENKRKEATDQVNSWNYLRSNIKSDINSDAISLLITLGRTKNLAEKYNFNHVVARA